MAQTIEINIKKKNIKMNGKIDLMEES